MQSATLAPGWLDNATTTGISGISTNVGTSYLPSIYGNFVWPSYCYHYDGPAKPIKLTFSEVERLRLAAKRDAKLKAILAKFTDQIELLVDFE